MKRLLLLLFSFSAAVPVAAYAQQQKFEYEFDHERPWVELQAQLPAYPKPENLLQFDPGPVSTNLHYVDAPSITVSSASLESGIGAADLAVHAGLAASKGEAGRLIKQGGLYVNDRRLSDERGQITMADAIGRSVIVLRKGQRERRIIRVEA